MSCLGLNHLLGQLLLVCELCQCDLLTSNGSCLPVPWVCKHCFDTAYRLLCVCEKAETEARFFDAQPVLLLALQTFMFSSHYCIIMYYCGCSFVCCLSFDLNF